MPVLRVAVSYCVQQLLICFGNIVTAQAAVSCLGLPGSLAGAAVWNIDTDRGTCAYNGAAPTNRFRVVTFGKYVGYDASYSAGSPYLSNSTADQYAAAGITAVNIAPNTIGLNNIARNLTTPMGTPPGLYFGGT
jgi:hypothetical protein